MAELIYQHRRHVNGSAGREYHVLVYGRLDGGGVWEAWLEFRPITGGLVLRTERETTQPSRMALARWAESLGHIDLEGAFARAFDYTSNT